MVAKLIIGVVIFGFVILVLTGLGILTTAIFAIKAGTISGQDPKVIANINSAIDKAGDINAAKKQQIIDSYPKSSITCNLIKRKNS